MDPAPDGLLLVDKPPGVSSAHVVGRVKRALPAGVRVGHAGTLDPFATGLLIVLVGRSTRRCESLMAAAKTYLATIKLGATTATDDPESPEILHPGAASGGDPVGLEAIRQAIGEFVGEIEQVPPKYSAVKIAGRRACDRVRRGQ
ncbi:MAG: tRNA pseudouridine(55) synthase TruB, partial [Phycisphaerae bacterium]|nr:tRNA pseudouridine(55) synthase TruB [Phycisphaerae bacterium]